MEDKELNIKIEISLDEGAKKPSRAHETDAGMDLYAPRDCIVPAHGTRFVDTGLHMYIPKGKCGMIFSKSGMNKHFSITSTGLVDAEYTGSIGVMLHNDGDEDYFVYAGDKISQIVILDIDTPELVEVKKLGDGLRGDNGFGSTGR